MSHPYSDVAPVSGLSLSIVRENHKGGGEGEEARKQPRTYPSIVRPCIEPSTPRQCHTLQLWAWTRKAEACTVPDLSIRMSHLREGEVHGQRCRARAWPLGVHGPLQSRGRRRGGRRTSICTWSPKNRARRPGDAVARATTRPGSSQDGPGSTQELHNTLPDRKCVGEFSPSRLTTGSGGFEDCPTH